MYKLIGETVPVYDKYANKLIEEGVMTREEKIEIENKYNNNLKASFDKSRSQNFDTKVFMTIFYILIIILGLVK